MRTDSKKPRPSTRSNASRVLFLATAVALSCGKSEDSTPNFAPITNLSDARGHWILDSVALEKDADQEIAKTGAYRLTIRPNSTFFFEGESLSISGGGNFLYKNCSAHSGANFKLEGENLFISNEVIGIESGECRFSANVPGVYSIDSYSRKAFINGDQLKITEDFSYTDKSANSKKDSLNLIFKRKSETEATVWNGKDFDPSFAGKWMLLKKYSVYYCSNASSADTRGTSTISGSMIFTVGADGSFETEVKDYGTSKCTGTSKGKIAMSSLSFKVEEASSTDSCASFSLPITVTPVYERDMVAASGDYVSVGEYKIATSSGAACVNNSAISQTIAIFRKQ